jgi:transcriptional regulator with XRE-family HTH domain
VGLRVGDNLVWEIDAGAYIDLFVDKFIRHSINENHSLIYVSFNRSPMTMVRKLSSLPKRNNITLLDCFTSGKGDNDPTFTKFYDSDETIQGINVIRVENPSEVIEFTKILNQVEGEKGAGARYIFDSITGMQSLWGDEVKTYKFFTYACPRLYDLDTVAYWILEREAHTPSFKANLEHVTQVSLEVSHINEQLFLKVTKAEDRYSPNMFKPQKFEVRDDDIVFREAADKEVLDIGGKVKELRLKRGLTQSELGKKIGVTASYISQLERNLVSPSIDSLIMLIDELQIDPGYFLSLNKTDPSQIVFRKNQREPIALASFRGNKVMCELLINSTENRRIQPMMVTIEPNSSFSEHFFRHKGDEFILILKGEIEVGINNKIYTLREGDSIYLDSVLPESWRNSGETPTQAIWILTPPIL